MIKLEKVTLKKIGKLLNNQNIQPTVLWSGNGYHIYLPLQSFILDSFESFSKDKFPHLFSSKGKYFGSSVSEVFLKYAENLFTGGKADPQHRPRYKTCLIRIPNTYNSKCLDKGLSKDESQVKIVEKWDGYRPPIQLLTLDFKRWLIQEEINDQQQQLTRKKGKGRINQFNKLNSSTAGETNNYGINWIENLLQRGIADGRKESLRLILGPYLSKRKSYDDAVIILQKWLDKCNSVNPLDRGFNSRQKIKFALKNDRGYQILDNLKTKYRWLYDNIIR